MEEDKTTNTMEVHRGLTIENQMVLLPEVNILIIIKIFLLGDSSTHTLTKDTTGGTPPPMFPSPTFNNTMASDAVGRSIIQLAENQSHSLDFILVGQQSQMDVYREMTHSNQAREDDALFAGINVYDGEDPSKI